MSLTPLNRLTLVYALRLFVPTLREVEEFRRQFPQYCATHRKYFKDKSKYVITVKLDQLMDLKPLEEFLAEGGETVLHDFFISVSSASDSEIVEIPDFVIDCIRKLGGKVNFSFTCIG